MKKQITKPESQVQEVLYELISRLYIDRKTMMLSSSVLNLPDAIMRLRRKGVLIESNKIKSFNKYGREVVFVQYSLVNKKEAIVVYNRLKENQC